jgi:hypothetical protein
MAKLEERVIGSILGHRSSSLENFNWLPFTPSVRLIRSFRICVTRGEQRAREVRVVRGEMNLVSLPKG